MSTTTTLTPAGSTVPTLAGLVGYVRPGERLLLTGVTWEDYEGLLDWRYHGRLVARQLDDTHVVIRATFDFRDFLLHSFPETFSVPDRFVKHMMIVADLEHGNADAVEDALIAAWELQSGN